MINNNDRTNPSQQPLLRILWALPIAGVIFSLALIAALVGYEVAYADRVYPGVHVQNIDLSGMTLEETNEKLADALQFRQQGTLQFTYQDQEWRFTPAELGYRVDPHPVLKRRLTWVAAAGLAQT